MIPAVNFRYFWDTLVNPRLGRAGHAPDAYVWGGSFSADDIDQGTDCSGAVSAELSAMVRGPGCIYQRQFFTGTFAGANPGDHGPWGGVSDTRDLVCIAHPNDAPPGTAMIIAIRQMADPTDAHMICSVPTTVGGPWTTIEMGGPPDNYHLGVTAIDNREFNQWFYLPGPIEGAPAPPPPPPVSNDSPLVAALKANGSFTSEQIRLIQGFSIVEGLNPAGNPTLGFTDAQLGGDASLVGHVNALAQQFRDRTPVAGPFPEGGSDLEQAQWIARVVGQAGLPSDWQGHAQPTDYVQRVVSAMPPRISPQPPPQPPPEEDDWLNMPGNQQMLQDIWNAIFTPQPPEYIYRAHNGQADDGGPGQNLVDSVRSILSIVTESEVEKLALLGEAASQNKVVRVARREGPELRQWAIDRSNLIWHTGLPGPINTSATVERVPGLFPPAAQLPPAPDRRDVELSNAYTEIGKLRAEIAQLQAAAPPATPISTEVATIEPAAPTTGESASRVIDAGQEWVQTSLAMNKVQQHALDASIRLLQMQTNGTEQ